MLPLAGLLVGVGPRQPEDVGEEALGEAVAAHDPLGQARGPASAEPDRAVDVDQAFALEALDHLRHRRAGDAEALGDAGLDDVDVVLVRARRCLAVLLERRVPLGHGRSLEPVW